MDASTLLTILGHAQNANDPNYHSEIIWISKKLNDKTGHGKKHLSRE